MILAAMGLRWIGCPPTVVPYAHRRAWTQCHGPSTYRLHKPLTWEFR